MAPRGADQAAAVYVQYTEESPDSTGQGCQVTPGGREPTESAAESRPPKGRRGVVKTPNVAHGKGERVR